MNKHSECNTREHILATGEQLCMHRGFTGMGLSELLKTAEVPKGSFYHYFRSKEAFGVALLDRLLAYYQHTLTQFCQQGIISGCLTVKLSAEVCDLSEDMRTAMDKGASQIITLLGDALEQGRQEGSLTFDGDALTLSQVLYSLWLGANLQAKITHSATPLESALAHAKKIIAAPAL